MNVLVACEESGRVTEAFRKKGHDAWSCDILPTSGGHPERKATCLWLNGLPKLVPTNIVEPSLVKSIRKDGRVEMRAAWHNRTGGGCGMERSKTYQGIADAMAHQWSEVCNG